MARLRAVVQVHQHTNESAHMDRCTTRVTMTDGWGTHMGARADLEAVTAEIMLIVRQLDALNRFRFRNDAESLAAWKSARDVAWPMLPEKEEQGVGETQKPAA